MTRSHTDDKTKGKGDNFLKKTRLPTDDKISNTEEYCLQNRRYPKENNFLAKQDLMAFGYIPERGLEILHCHTSVQIFDRLFDSYLNLIVPRTEDKVYLRTVFLLEDNISEHNLKRFWLNQNIFLL